MTIWICFFFLILFTPVRKGPMSLFVLILPSILLYLLQNTGKNNTESFATIVNGFTCHIETSLLIYSANQWTGFNMIRITAIFAKRCLMLPGILKHMLNGNTGTRWVSVLLNTELPLRLNKTRNLLVNDFIIIQ